MNLRARTVTAGTLETRVISLEEYLNKPLPALPQPPYFEYMFADAGIEGKKLQCEKSADSDLKINYHSEFTFPDFGPHLAN